MKLYPKQLNSLEELKREKRVMKYAVKHSDDIFSFGDSGREDETSDAAGAGILGAVISALGSRSVFSTVLAIVPPVLTLLSKSSGRGKKKKNPLQSIALEVITGYLKWKAVSLAWKGLMHMIRPEKEQERQ